ncbi:lysozyme S [Drosophila grimshawi]|uniref:lysozyme n=1 Tax=Drosophila grimshawi TaxID=7222 RepID=B4J229_DROGR|nr:lysozyme S [Drosophila grimshawi]EDV95954.1 GH15988 [Drosophila grimshawi]
MKVYIVVGALAVLASLVAPGLARTMDRCSLANEMSNLGVPRDQLARWTCIAERESSYRTHVVGPANTDGSHDHGIFQLNDRYWCQARGRRSSNLCGLSCDTVRTDDITNAVRCAQRVLSIQGWTAWSVWRFCSGDLPSIDPCF